MDEIRHVLELSRESINDYCSSFSAIKLKNFLLRLMILSRLFESEIPSAANHRMNLFVHQARHSSDKRKSPFRANRDNRQPNRRPNCGAKLFFL
jgi:hypothetical protein